MKNKKVLMENQKILPTEKVTIFADTREVNSNIAFYLKDWECDVIEKQLKVGDYIVSDRVCLERKTISDFLQSVFDQRIFKQVENLIESYQRPLLIMEGSPEGLFYERDVHPNTIRGVLASIAIDYRIPIIWTHSPKETAAQIYWIAYREQKMEKRELAIRVNKKNPSISRQQEFLIAGLPGISNLKARKLLQKFKTPEKVFRAKEGQLQKVEGFGEKSVKRIKELLQKEYKNEKENNSD